MQSPSEVYKQAIQSARQDELRKVRQQGLTTQHSQHFTEKEREASIRKAAFDAALKELEERRPEYLSNNSIELLRLESLLDALPLRENAGQDWNENEKEKNEPKSNDKENIPQIPSVNSGLKQDRTRITKEELQHERSLSRFNDKAAFLQMWAQLCFCHGKSTTSAPSATLHEAIRRLFQWFWKLLQKSCSKNKRGRQGSLKYTAVVLGLIYKRDLKAGRIAM
jgi:hypothetical protein